ncbi:Nitrogen permease regulator 3 [Rhizina undulata]
MPSRRRDADPRSAVPPRPVGWLKSLKPRKPKKLSDSSNSSSDSDLSLQPDNMQRTSTPNPCLIAILLVVRSTSGVNFVFHYPSRPKAESAADRRNSSYQDGNSSNSDSSSGSSDEDDQQSRTTIRDPAAITATELTDSEDRSYVGGGGRKYRRRQQEHEDENNNKNETDENGGPPWETVLGFKAAFLASLLAPKPHMCKTRFELSIDDMVFLGYPLQQRPDGTWRKKKKRRRGGDGLGDEAAYEGEENELTGTGDATEDDERAKDENYHDADADDEKDDMEDGNSHENMSMFHVVFVLNPPELEYHVRVQEMYDYIVKRFTSALKYEQAKNGYVWKEADIILRLKEKALQRDINYQDLWKEITAQSNLAYAIARIYNDISQSRIAHVYLNNNLALSLQIPIVSEISVLPSITDSQLTGLPLTTANSFGDDENEGDGMLAKHFTLLFLEDVDSILKDIASESSESTASLAHFVRACKPSLSFLQISNSCDISLQEIQLMARHLVHWRKARAIPPIHQRDTYIVSPNADMKKLHSLIPAYSKLFPTLPSLPKLLNLLSSKPKPFSTFIPSKDHRPAYLEILAWLIRHGLVTQLRNFAWIKITKEIKAKVAKERSEEALSKLPHGGSGSGNAESMASSAASLLSNLGCEGIGPVDEDAFEDSLILEPQKASSLESAWLEMMTRDQPSDVRALFDRMTKYLNGEHAIEKIAVREGISRKDVRRVLGALEKYIVYVRPFV